MNKKFQNNLLLSAVFVFFILLGFVGFLLIQNVRSEKIVRVYISYDGKNISTKSENIDLYQQIQDEDVTVLGQFRNSSNHSCSVSISSAEKNTSFSVSGGDEYGEFLPKDPNLSITFCELQAANIYTR